MECGRKAAPFKVKPKQVQNHLVYFLVPWPLASDLNCDPQCLQDEVGLTMTAVQDCGKRDTTSGYWHS